MAYDPTSTEGLTEHGRERLAQMKKGMFTSDLSVNEFLLVKQAGFDPLGLVIGSSIYHIGYQQSSWKQSMEMAVLSQAMYAARDLAMTRMEEEADQLGADGIVGVRQFLAAIQEAHPEIVTNEPEGRVGQRTIPRVVGQRSPLRAGIARPD